LSPELDLGFLGGFVKLQKATVSCVVSICPSVGPFFRMQHHGKDFNEMWCWNAYRKTKGYIQVTLKSDNSNGNLREDHISPIAA
jgi:hypothetical protein